MKNTIINLTLKEINEISAGTEKVVIKDEDGNNILNNIDRDIINNFLLFSFIGCAVVFLDIFFSKINANKK